MSRLKQLIDKLCPNGVEYKTLGGISNKIIDGSHNPPKKGIGNKLYPMISAKNINNGKIDFIDARMISKEDFEIENKRTQVTQNDLLITIVGAIGRVAVVETEMNVVFQRSVCVIKVKHEKINSKFLKYVLESNVIQSKILRMANGAAQKGIYLNQVEKIKIPVPPLEVQNEIVRLLDNFTELTAELTAELLKRKQQYQYYRDLLLNFENDINISDKSSVKRLIRELCPNGVEYKTLGKIADVTKLAGFEFTQYVNYADKGKIIALRGLNVKNGNLDLSEVKYIDDSDFNKLSRSKLYINDMLFTYVGTVGEVALVDENDRYYLAPNVARIRFLNENVNPVFMRYYFQTHQFIKSQLDKYMAMSSMKNLTMEKIRKFKVPLPPLEVQNKIVEILDRFNTLANDITCGLPAEIELQQKRYEYFRDLLLTFDDSLSDNAQGLKGSRARIVFWLRFGDTCTLKAGKSISANNISSEFDEENRYPCYGANGIRGYVSNFNEETTASIIGRQGALCGSVHYAEGKYYATEHAVVVKSKGFYLPRFLYYLLTVANLSQYKTAGAQPGLSVSKLENIMLPIPSLEEQQRIVNILDRFDKLCNDITCGLPAEIELHQKRYEYYRDKLLSFRELQTK